MKLTKSNKDLKLKNSTSKVITKNTYKVTPEILQNKISTSITYKKRGRKVGYKMTTDQKINAKTKRDFNKLNVPNYKGPGRPKKFKN